MEEANLKIVPQGYQQLGKDVNLKVESQGDVEEEYKFLLGRDGKWETLRSFSKEEELVWKGEEPGEYLFIVQVKKKGSKYDFDYSVREKYFIKEKEIPLRVDEFHIDKEEVLVGEKISIVAKSNRNDAAFKFLTKENGQTITLSEAGPHKEIEYHFATPGTKEIILNCFTTNGAGKKSISLTKKVNVVQKETPRIKNIEYSKENLYIRKNIRFNVILHKDIGENVLYKFMRVTDDGRIEILRDYSSKDYIDVEEKKIGKHVLLCYVKDMFSMNEYDDRAKMVYKIKEDQKRKIEEITTDLSSPQQIGTEIKVRALVKESDKLLYRFSIVKMKENTLYECTDKNDYDPQLSNKNTVRNTREESVMDTDYIGVDRVKWTPMESGKYKIRCMIKRRDGRSYDDSKEIEFQVEEFTQLQGRITGIEIDKDINSILAGEPLNMTVDVEEGFQCLYKFSIYREGEKIHETEYIEDNEIEFIPNLPGEYKFLVDVRGDKSKREYDSREIFILQVLKYIPGKIEYILYDLKNYYSGDSISFEVIGEKSGELLYKYNIYCDGILIEETDYSKEGIMEYRLRRYGDFRFEFFIKNSTSDQEFDGVKNIEIKVAKGKPITKSAIEYNNENPKCYGEIVFKGECNIEKDIVYEFYINFKNQWYLFQRYSNKNFFAYIPKEIGEYKVLMLVKHIGNNDSYEHYCIRKFEVEK